ncbi:MAG: helix-turn-helix domain-containing protein [Gaiellaceae bacterium]|jgi:excisionase family DNA binding protein
MSVEGSDQEFLGVRETAKRLGVHENTVRNWARDGILPTARIPGSRFHRFAASDVERLRRQRGEVVSSVESERRTIGPELVDGTQLRHWAATRDSHDAFPELVRRLLASTPGITDIAIRSGDGVYVEGWDGLAESDGTAYLPGGSLCFEFGVGSRTKKKADEDYEKRRDDPDGVVAAQSVFIFITPRRWRGAAAWANERRAEKVFADVRVLDADNLEAWLQATPAVHHWISEHLGRRPREAETLEQWWARFQAQTEPALPAALFLAGRESEQKQLTEFLIGAPGVIAIQGAWCNEAIAFVCATIEVMEREVSNAVQPPLIVSSNEVWDRVVLQPGRMTLIPLFEDPDIATAQDRGHHVVLPAGRERVVRGTKIELPRPHRQGAAEALEAAGVDSDRTYQLAALARRSMPSLIRTLARDPRIARPPWARLPDAAQIAPLVLIGAWGSSEEDTGVVDRVTQNQWPVIERTLLHWRSTDDPPFVQSGNQWHLASPEEAFLVLHDALTPSDVARWREIAIEVLLEPDPQLELPPEDRPIANIKGVSRKYSSALRRGFAEGIALVGSLDAERLSDGISGLDHSRRVVHEILDRASNDASIWRSLSDVLPLLAEAAPNVFLDALHDDLDRDQPLLATMFQDDDQSSWLYSSSPHTGLLWALETLCWSPDFLIESSRALARLQAVDPGGRLANRPLGSLESVLVGWIHHTAAPLELRISAIEQICRQIPGVGWHLLLGLWPSQGGAALSPPSSPRFHDWRPESRHVLVSEWIEYIAHLVRLAIELADSDIEHWSELVEQLGPLPPAERNKLLDALDVVADPESMSTEQRLLLWERLHKEIAHHRQFPDADWSMGVDPLSRMQGIADRLEPTTNVERFGYLFDWRPDLPGIDPYDHVAYDAKLLELRMHAVKETLATTSIEGICGLAERSPVPGQLGWIVGAIAPEDLASELLTWLDSENPKLREVALNWAARKLQEEGGVKWLVEALTKPEMTQPSRRVALALRAPSTSEVWDALAETDAELLAAYWSGVEPWRVPAEDAERAARELLIHGRAWVAVDLLSTEIHRPNNVEPSITPSLVEDVLDAAMTADPNTSGRVQSLGYEVGLLLDYLEKANADTEKLTRYEFVFFRLLDHHRQPRALFESLNNNASLFVDLVSRVYRGKNEPRRQLDEREEALAHHAWWVLNGWHGLPGRREDGPVDGRHLEQWVRQARLAFSESERTDIGDEQIGQVLAASPLGADGVWPAEPVRDIVEAIGSPNLETGVHIGVVNSRGVTSRGVYDGGKQERELSARYREWAKQTSTTWPRTSRVLRGLAENYEQDAQREDERAELDADTL